MQKLHLQSFGMRDVRIVNELRLLNMIRQYQPISRVQISRLTALNASTVTTIVKRLLAHDMISEGMPSVSTGGRTPTLLTVNPEKMSVLGIDLGLSQTSYTIADFNGQQIHSQTLPTVAESEDFIQSICDNILQDISRIRPGADSKLRAVGISVPELVDVQEGT